MPGILQIEVEIPALLVGRIIGKGGSTIKEITERSGARVNVNNGGGAEATLAVSGRPEALESARMLINNALTSAPHRR